MAHRKIKGSTIKQMAYAKRLLGGQGQSKKEIALNAGYAPSVASSVAKHVESSQGFNNAVMQLALDSNNLALAAMHEFKMRGFKDFSNKELVGALNAIGGAWSRFNAERIYQSKNSQPNKLRTVVLQQIENQNISSPVVATTQGQFNETSMGSPDDVVATIEDEDDF